MQYWVLKVSPKSNDLADVFRHGTASWYSHQRPKLLPGDRVFMWVTSPRLNIQGLAVATDAPPRRDPKKTRWLIDVRVVRGPFENPLGIKECRALPRTGKASFLKAGPMGTFFSIEPAQARELISALSKRNKGLSGVWRELGGRRPRPSPRREDAFAEIQREAEHLRGLSQTTRDQIVKARLGQGLFRKRLDAYWKGCAVTGCRVSAVLKASHIKPWRVSKNNERLDRDNGLLLTASLDALFDAGLIAFGANGVMRLSRKLTAAARNTLGLKAGMRLQKTTAGHKRYLAWHRKNIFKS